MTIKGWIILGGGEFPGTLPMAAFRGRFPGMLPPANNYPSGAWIEWQMVPGGPVMILACVEMPMMQIGG